MQPAAQLQLLQGRVHRQLQVCVHGGDMQPLAMTLSKALADASRAKACIVAHPQTHSYLGAVGVACITIASSALHPLLGAQFLAHFSP